MFYIDLFFVIDEAGGGIKLVKLYLLYLIRQEKKEHIQVHDIVISGVEIYGLAVKACAILASESTNGPKERTAQ